MSHSHTSFLYAGCVSFPVFIAGIYLGSVKTVTICNLTSFFFPPGFFFFGLTCEKNIMIIIIHFQEMLKDRGNSKVKKQGGGGGLLWSRYSLQPIEAACWSR